MADLARLISRVRMRLHRMAQTRVPWQERRYRPHGTTTSRAWLESRRQGDHYHQMVPERTFRPRIPEDMALRGDQYGPLYDERLYPEVGVAVIDGGRLYTDNVTTVSVITPDRALLSDLSVEFGPVTYRGQPGQSRALVTRLWPQPRHVQGTVFPMLIGHGGIHNFFHWMLDVLPRLGMLQKLGLFDQVDWFLVPSLRHEYQRRTLAALGVPPKKCLLGDENPHIIAERLLAPTPARYAKYVPEWAIDYLREGLLPLAAQADPTRTYPKRLYLSRRDTAMRPVANEDLLLEQLRPHGFVPLAPTDYDFAGQVRLFSQAEVIVASHGAGLTGLLYASPQTRVLEFFAGRFVSASYCQIAQRVGLKYHYLIESDPPLPQVRQALYAPTEANIPRIMAEVERMLWDLDRPTAGPAN